MRLKLASPKVEAWRSNFHRICHHLRRNLDNDDDGVMAVDLSPGSLGMWVVEGRRRSDGGLDGEGEMRRESAELVNSPLNPIKLQSNIGQYNPRTLP
ncbi:hypothetical protein L6452_06273 [Arctium lappa]|uniref:Uncharacterized protein n=1 Tax=Arctium lappa TaxID=4217 RepID=A0ACB9EIQ2_ARCLA|nr:hypothetical protein L6452_06273 [Arctium lappa]